MERRGEGGACSSPRHHLFNRSTVSCGNTSWLCRVIPRHGVSDRIIPCHPVSYRVQYRVRPCHVVSCRVIPCHVLSHRVMSCAPANRKSNIVSGGGANRAVTPSATTPWPTPPPLPTPCWRTRSTLVNQAFGTSFAVGGPLGKGATTGKRAGEGAGEGGGGVYSVCAWP